MALCRGISETAIVNEEQKREALAKTQQYLAASAGRKVVQMGEVKSSKTGPALVGIPSGTSTLI